MHEAASEKRRGGDDELRVARDGPVRIVTLHRPDALNAVNESLHAELASVWDELAGDDDADVVVLTGSGRAFSAGGDLDYIRRFADDPELRRRTIDEALAILWAMVRFPLPLIAAVNGPAVGLGVSLALGADIVLMSDRASFSDPHVSVGLVCGDGGAALLPLVAPLLRAKELLFTGDRVTPDVAVQLGMANRVVPHDDLRAEALALAHRIAAQPRFALRETKRAVQLGVERAVTGVAEVAAQAELESMATPEHAARIDAMVERSTSARRTPDP